MGLLGRVKKRMAKSAGIAEAQAPYVPACPGMAEGFLVGNVIARSVEWDAVLHPDLGEYTIREKGCDETTGYVIHVPVSLTRKLVVERGVLWDPKKDKPAEGYNVLGNQHGKHWYLPLERFVNLVLDHTEEQLNRAHDTPAHS